MNWLRNYSRATVVLRICDVVDISSAPGVSAPDGMENGHATSDLTVLSDDAPDVSSETRYVVERRWKEPGAKSKIFVNEQGMTGDGFSEFILDELRIPKLHFPKGDPYGARTWPALSWRMLLRHIYRRELFWSDLADRQPESETTCMSHSFFFSGVALPLYFRRSMGSWSRSSLEELKHSKEEGTPSPADRFTKSRLVLSGRFQ